MQQGNCQYSSQGCNVPMKYQSGYFVLDANHGSWPVSGFCQAISTKIILTNSYQVAAQLLNYQGWNGANSGHLGLIYNVENSGNYDFVYFRYVSMVYLGYFCVSKQFPETKSCDSSKQEINILNLFLLSHYSFEEFTFSHVSSLLSGPLLFLPPPIFVASKTC